MDRLMFIAELIKALAWPGTVIFLVIWLRAELVKLLPRLTDFEGYGVKAKFEKAVREVAAEAPKAEEPTVADIAPAATRSEVLEAWLELEKALINLASVNDISALPGRTQSLVKALIRRELINENDVRLIDQLRQLRNMAVHEHALTITPAIAAEYVSVASNLTERLRAASGKRL